MNAPRHYPPEVVEDVRRRIALGETIRSVATFHGMSPSTVSNMARGRIYKSPEQLEAEAKARAAQSNHAKEHLDSARAKANAQAQRQRAAKRAEREQLARTTTLVEQAKAERSKGRPLVVDTLIERLQRAIPGAYVVGARPCDNQREPFAVWCPTHRLATGHTEREAVDRAIALWGGR